MLKGKALEDAFWIDDLWWDIIQAINTAVKEHNDEPIIL